MLRLQNSLLLNEEFIATLRKISGYKIPVSAGLKLLRLCKVLEDERRLVAAARDTLIRNYGEDDGKGRISVPTSNAEVMREFGREYHTLMTSEFDSSLEEKIRLASLRDKEGQELHLSLAELALLTQVIDFESPAPS